MVALAAIGLGLNALGGIFGGRKRKKAAKALAAQQEQHRLQANQLASMHTGAIDALTNAGIAELSNDQARALQLRADDEARLKAATGYDMVKLVADAEASGFNPLTVLNATGGAGYDGRGAVMTSPFVGRADGFFNKANTMVGQFGQEANVHLGGSSNSLAAGQGVVQASGYFGDALSGLGAGLFDLGNQATQRNHEFQMLQAQMGGGGSAPQRAAGGTPFSPRKGGSAPLVDARVITASPIKVSGVGRAPKASVAYPGLQTLTSDETRAPMTGFMVDPLWGLDWYIGNPDLDNEPLNAAMLMTLPGQAAMKTGGWMGAAGGSASRPMAPPPGGWPTPKLFGRPLTREAWSTKTPARTPNRAEVFQ